MKVLYFALIAVFIFSCKSNQKSSPSMYALEKVWETDTVLVTSESALYDTERGVIYVSCINKNPREKDENGYVSKVSTTGTVIDTTWITGMHAPKGMGLFGELLYVADIDEVIVVNVIHGEIARRIPVDGAKMLNDITIDVEGKIYVTDTDDNKIYVISEGEVGVYVDAGLNAPNGLLVESERLLLASMGTSDLVAFNLSTMSKTLLVDSINKGDGIIKVDEQTYIVSDWFGELFLVDSQNNKTSLLNTKAENIGSADLGFIPELNLVLVPTFNANTLVAYTLNRK